MKIFGCLLLCILGLQLHAQPPAPDELYGELFADVQMNRVYADGKTFVDCLPKRDPKAIVSDYMKLKKEARKNKTAVDLKKFVQENFTEPGTPNDNYHTDPNEDVETHIRKLWTVLKRNPDQPQTGSSLLPLPNAYIVPGGRFREIYYWDSFFTMLGLKESGEDAMIENMVKNFAYLIDTYGHIPNGNRTYYLGRSQPPFFAAMVQLLASIKGDGVYTQFLPELEKEYNYWMEGADKLKSGEVHRRVVKMPDGSVLNRYWDDSEVPRQESYKEDFEVAQKSGRDRIEMYHHLRAGAESGIDFSSRWFTDAKSITLIITTDYIAVDLNSLLYNLEMVLVKAHTLASTGNAASAAKSISAAANYQARAKARKEGIEKYCWSNIGGCYADYNFRKSALSDNGTLAGMYPLYFGLADRARAEKEKKFVVENLLKAGGFVNTIHNTGEQWDAPNGWAPLEWMAIMGLEQYGYYDEAKEAASRWVKLNIDVYKRTGKLMEKYNVVDTHLDAGGGEYQSQDGFGWTNGVLLALKKKYAIE